MTDDGMETKTYSNDDDENHSITTSTGRRGTGRMPKAWSIASTGNEGMEQGEELLETEEQASEYDLWLRRQVLMNRLLMSEQAMLLFIRSVSLFVRPLSRLSSLLNTLLVIILLLMNSFSVFVE